MHIYGMWPWKVPKWPWFWAEVAVKAWRDLATLKVTIKSGSASTLTNARLSPPLPPTPTNINTLTEGHKHRHFQN
jgi:hypothetical protein